jgi:hypothetical protein
MYNNGNSSKNVTGASVVDGTLENADFADNTISGDKIDAGIISNFQSTGIDDRSSTGKNITLTDSNIETTCNITIDTADAQIILEGDSKASFMQDNAYFSHLLTGCYHDGSNIVYGATGRGAARITFEHDSSSNQSFRFYTASSGTAGNTASFSYGALEASAFTVSSDHRLKENVVPMSASIDRLKQLKPCRFNFIDSEHMAYGNVTVDGFLAHEAGEVVPESVIGEKDAVDGEGNPDYQGIDQSKLVPLLVSALQEAITRIEQLENN